MAFFAAPPPAPTERIFKPPHFHRFRAAADRFGLWIPLRRQEHTKDGQGTVQPIENRFPPPVLDELLGEDWRRRLAETLPLLRRIHAVRFCQSSQDAWQTVAEMRVGAGARRMRFGTEPGLVTQGTSIELSGQVEEAGRLAGVIFRGTESFVALPALTQLRDHSAWPSQSALGPDWADLQVKEKAEPHGAVIFTRQAAEGQPALRVHQAVFLPLGEPDQVSCTGMWRYNLYLHGFFFVDSGRRGIQPFDELPEGVTPENAKSESQVTQLWNRTLLHELVAPLVLPSLEAFVRQEQMQSGEIESLVCSLVKSEPLKKLTDWMCRGQRFIHRLKKDGGAWILEAWAVTGGKAPRWLKLPEPDFPEADLFELLPTLTHLCGEASVSFDGKPKLAVSVPVKPSDEELAGLLGAVAASAFQNTPHLIYLLKLMPDKGGVDSQLITSLVKLANLLLNQRLPEGQELRALWTQFFQRLPAETFIRLPCDSTNANPEIVHTLAGATLPVAVLWEDCRNADGKGTLDWESLLSLLQRLGGLHLADALAVRQRSAIVVRLLQACDKLPPAWTDAIAKLPLFDARTPSGAGSATSIAELQTASGEDLLFTGGKEWAADLAKAAPTLKPLLIAQDVAEVLDLGAATCDSAACVALLRDAPALAGDFASRGRLFARILPAAQHEDDAWAALRCLLHGEISEWQQTVTLFDETGAAPVLLRLLEKSLLASGQPWRRIPAALVGQLQVNAQHRQHLKLVPASEANIEALISEVGPATVDCAELTREDCDYILGRFNDVDVLHGLNIHETLDGHRVRIGLHSYVDDGTFTDLPEQFNDLVKRLRDRPGYARFCNNDGSNRLVNRLSWEAVVELALRHSEPAQCWDAILTAIGHLGNLRVELRDRVRGISWLPQADGDGTPVAPSVLLHVPGAETELDRLPDNILAGRIPLRRLAQSVSAHGRFDTFKKSTILPPAKEALATLATLLGPHAGWSTGLTGEWSAEQIADWVQILGCALEQSLPVARLVNVLHDQPPIRELLPAFLQGTGGRLTESAYAEILKCLTATHEIADVEKRQRVETVFLRYLNAINAAGAEFARRVLTGMNVRLMSGSGSWKAPSQLAFPTNGVIPDDLLCPRQADALASLQLPHPHEGAHAPQGEEAVQQFEHDLHETPDRLITYFAPWTEFVPREVVGAFLCVLGDAGGIRNLAEQFLGQRSVDGTRAELSALSTRRTGLVQALASHRFACVVHGESMMTSPSVTGEPFEARLGGNKQTIFFGSGVRAFPVAGNWTSRRLHLLAFDPAEESNAPERLATLLRASSESILSFVFCQTGINLQPLWDTLSQPSQLHIRIAQNRVVEAAQAFLRQIGAHHTNQVQQVLKDWDTADRRRAEAEENNRQVPSEVQRQLTEAKQRLRALLAGHEETQQGTLAAVRRKIAEYQYDPSSVPIELWQNADDALVELGDLGFDCERADALGFVVEGGHTTVAFGHWGRPINEFQGAEGRNLRERGFDQDVEKMVVQSISDKGAAGEPGAAVTGKFGLGFKSVFLVSDAPEVLSGSVDFVIRGGIYPVRLNESERDQLRETLKAIAPDDWRRGTIIRLPLRANGEASTDAVLSLFRRLAPLLVVFSRRLRRLRFRSQNQEDAELRWHPEQVADGIEIGALETLEGGVKNALVLSRTVGHDRVQFLLGLNADGFIPLPDDVPLIWVTAPTRDPRGYGFAVNGPFEPDVGRVQLALQSEKNRQLAGDLAGVLATRLKLLGERSSTGWPAVREELKLATGASAYGFWNSLWDLLGKRFAARCHTDKSPVAALARRILWESKGDGLHSFYRECAALPTGLWGDYRVLTRLRDLHHVAAGALDREAVFRTVSGWKEFQQRVAIGTICSGKHVASVLEQLGVPLRETEMLHLATVVDWELGKEKRADPELAAHLGKLITPEFMTGLEKGTAGEREESEHKRLVELLRVVSFQAADSSWHKTSELVAAASAPGVEKDEMQRAAFAPRECQLNPAYTGSAFAFFIACRSRLEADVETMAAWVLQAADEETRVAALHYLLDGDRRHGLADGLRLRRDAEIWLWKLESFDWFKTNFSDDQRHKLLAHVLQLFEEKLRELTGTGAGEELRLETKPPPKHIWTVEELWKWWDQHGKPMGDYTLEGAANWELFHGGWIPDEQDRKAELKRLLRSDAPVERNPLWYRLFGYACLVSAGRHTTELRKFWKERLNPRQFWERTSRGDFSEETREIFELAVTAQFSEAAYYWRRVFYDLRKVHRMVCVNDFPSDLMRLVDEGYGQHLRDFLSSGRLPGLDQQRWVGTFGQSSDAPLGFIIRELVRLEVITDESVRPSAFFVCRPVLRALAKIGWISDDESVFSGEQWLAMLAKDGVHGPLLRPYYDIPLLHMGITHRGDLMPVPPR